MTTTDYLQAGETVQPRELAHGALRVADEPPIAHQRTVGELFLAMAPLVEARELGEILLAPTDVILDFEGALVVQPDIVFVSNERRYMAGDRVVGAPDLVIEVLSPRSRIGRLDEHIGWFARYGVRECWLVSLPERRVAVLTLNEHGVVRRSLHSSGERLPSAVLRGFVMPALFAWESPAGT